MPVRKLKKGSGITERDHLRISAPFGKEENEALRQLFVGRVFDFEGLHGGPLRTWANDVLREAGVPNTEEARLRADGTFAADLPDGWDKHPGEVLGPGEQAGSTLGLVGDRFGRDSPEGYAARILSKLEIIESELAHGNAVSVARFAFELGTLASEASMKFKWERDALRGYKNAEVLGNNRDTWNRAKKANAVVEHQRWCSEARKIKENNPALSMTATAQCVIKRLDLPNQVDHVRKILGKKLDTLT